MKVLFRAGLTRGIRDSTQHFTVYSSNNRPSLSYHDHFSQYKFSRHFKNRLHISIMLLICGLLAVLTVAASGHLIIRDKFTWNDEVNEDWHCSNSVNWTVFYETGCPDSNHHFTYVLNPNYEAFQPQLILNLVPFGNAERFHSDNFGYTFACQHGIEELRTNTFQACGRKLLPEKSFNSLVMCQMGTGTVPATFKSWEYCSKVNSIDYNTLYNCYADRTEGMNALIKMEQLSADNGHTFIPWFALNGNMNSTVQMMGLAPGTFVKLLCSELCPDSQPDICSH